jgi:hypothetical protein
MLKERPPQGLSRLGPSLRKPYRLFEGRDIIREEVGQITALGLRRDLLIRIELRGMWRQPLDLQPTSEAFPEPYGRPSDEPANGPRPE